MVTIGASLIVKNEEELLGRCLESLKGFDEIVVVDTGSEDKTIEIAKKYTDKVYTDFTWCDSFCKARNHALSKMTADWVYTIDADEELRSPVEKLREWIVFAEKKNWLAVNVQVSSGRDAFFSPRLYKRDPRVFWRGDVHNHLSVLGAIDTDIQHHYDYSPAHKKDPDRAYRILSKVVKENPDCVREKFYLAREYWYRKDYNTAILWYKNYLLKAYFAPEMADANLMIARCYNAMGDWNTAKDYCLQAIKINANYKEAIEFLASLSGPGNSKRWLEFAKTATNEAVLFINSPSEVVT